MRADFSQQIYQLHTQISAQDLRFDVSPDILLCARPQPRPARFDLGFDARVDKDLLADEEVEE
jgi:hypothetical protein